MKKPVYLDNAATTPLLKEVYDKMAPYFMESFANPMTYMYSSLGLEAFKALEQARHQAANLINAQAENIVFTGSGTESDNMAIKGVAFKKKKGHIITSKFEHHAVLHTVEALKRHGFSATFVDIDKDGFVDLNQIEDSIKQDTILISIMHANNEIGTIQPIEQISKLAHSRGILFHTDAVQSCAHIEIDVQKIGCDFLSISAHKFNGPKGVGFLYIKDKDSIYPLIDGGAQEWGLRSSTHNMPGIVGLGVACEIAQKNLTSQKERLANLRDYFLNQLIINLDGVSINGSMKNRLPQNLNVQIDGINNDSLLVGLNKYGVIAAGGSACTATDTVPSHVLVALGLTPAQANSSVRFSFGVQNSQEEIDYALENVIKLVKKFRALRG